MDHFKKFVPFAKVEEGPNGSAIVHTRATREELDSQGEVVGIDASVAAWTDWSKWYEKTTKAAGQEPSKGNVRAMHEPIGAGKVADWMHAKEDKAIDAVLEVVDPAEALKCKTGVYTGVSISGSKVKREMREWDGKKVPFVVSYQMNELSLVDKGACPSAVFTMVKRDGAQDAEASEAPETAEKEKAAEPRTAVCTLRFSKAKFTAEQAQAWAKEHGFRAGKAIENAAAGNEPTWLIAQRPADDFEKTDQVDLLDGVAAMAGPLKPGRFEKVMGALAPGLKKYSEYGSIMPLLCCLRDIQSFMDSEAFETAMGADAAEQAGDIAAAGGLVGGLLDLIESEFEQQVRSYAVEDGAARSTGMALLERVAGLSKALSPFQLKKLAADEAFAGEMGELHKLGHSLVKATEELGIVCPGGECAEEKKAEAATSAASEDIKTPAKEAAALPSKKESLPTGSLQKVLDAVSEVGAQVKGQSAEIASVKEAVAKLEPRIETLDKQITKIGKAPAPVGRPVHSPEKLLGAGGLTPAQAADEASADAAALQRLAAKTSDPIIKRALVLEAAALVAPGVATR